MKALILGRSNIVSRRVLPALEAVARVEAIDIASRRAVAPDDTFTTKLDRVFNDYQVALHESDAAWVYVSTVNSDHAYWVDQALVCGYHVAVDKPAVLSADDAVSVVELASSKGLAVAEATVNLFHPQAGDIQHLFRECGCEPTRATAVFSMPPLRIDNFRYSTSSGGGAIYDLGPYAASLARWLFGTQPERIEVSLSHDGPQDAETSFSVLTAFAGGRSLVGHFGFDTEYRNELTVLGSTLSLTVERFFTTPPDLENRIRWSSGNRHQEHLVAAADAFACFVETFLDACEQPLGSAASSLKESFMFDARFLAGLRKQAGFRHRSDPGHHLRP